MKWTDEQVKKFAAECIWETYGKTDCRYVVNKFFETYQDKPDESSESSVWPGEEEINEFDSWLFNNGFTNAMRRIMIATLKEWYPQWLQSKTAVKAESSQWEIVNTSGEAGQDYINSINENQSQPTAGGGIFQKIDITLNSGSKSDFKIECDNLTGGDIECIAYLLSKRVEFFEAIGIPRGGIRLAEAMNKYATKDNQLPTLICDDVLTTGNSMKKFAAGRPNIIGAVIFAREQCPEWVTPLFQLTAGGVKEERWDDKTQLYGLLQIIKDDPCYLHLDGRIQKTIESIGNHVVKKYEMGKDSQIPRRIRLDLSEPAELAIRNAVDEVEKIGADVRLTNAINLLNEARELVADYIDKVPLKSQPSPSNPSIKRPSQDEIDQEMATITEYCTQSEEQLDSYEMGFNNAINWLLSIQPDK